jgi:hypothetical protein
MIGNSSIASGDPVLVTLRCYHAHLAYLVLLGGSKVIIVGSLILRQTGFIWVQEIIFRKVEESKQLLERK